VRAGYVSDAMVHNRYNKGIGSDKKHAMSIKERERGRERGREGGRIKSKAS
jgi:hypothetical protein